MIKLSKNIEAVSIQNPNRTKKTSFRKQRAKDQENFVKVFALGGLGEVGRNMYLIEYKNEILIIDMGLRFPEEDMPGIDYIIPNIRYLVENKNSKKIVGVFVTHAHFDHIGAISYIAHKIGSPTIYATPLTREMILKRHQEFSAPPLNIVEIRPKQRIQAGPFEVEAFHQNHNVFDSVGYVIDTPVGRIVNTGDFKIDFSPVKDVPADLQHIAEIGMKDTLLLMQDSTRAEVPGFSLSESAIQSNLEEIFKFSKGRIIAATFSSLISRIQQLIDLSEKYRRYVIIQGRSMINAVEIAIKLGYINLKHKDTIIKINKLQKLPDDRITIICTGAQGEPDAVLMRIINNEHKHIKIKKGDTIIFSSSVIPGNERTVQALKDELIKRGAQVFHNQMMDVHAGGHAHQEDLKLMINLIKPKFFMPIHGNFSMMSANKSLAINMGIPEQNIIMVENGDIVKLYKDKFEILQKRIPANYVFVDGLGIGDVGSVVLRDRQTMAQDGMFVVIAVIDAKTGKLKDEPDIISRGFVYLKESKKLIEDARNKVKEIINSHISETGSVNYMYVKNLLRDELGEFLFKKTRRRPLVLPVVIEV